LASQETIQKTSEELERIKRIKFKTKNFNKSFIQLREKLCLSRVSRKFHIDSILKKVKSKIFKTIYDSLKSCLMDNYPLIRYPQTIVTDINIDSNKYLFNKTIKDIYEDSGIHLNIENLKENNFIRKGKYELLKEFLSLTFVEIHKVYLESMRYIKDTDVIIRKEGKKFGELFKFIAINFVDYFINTKGNKTRSKSKLQNNPNLIFKVIPKKKFSLKLNKNQFKIIY